MHTKSAILSGRNLDICHAGTIYRRKLHTLRTLLKTIHANANCFQVKLFSNYFFEISTIRRTEVCPFEIVIVLSYLAITPSGQH